MKTLLSINNYHYRGGGADILYLEHAALFARRGWQTAAFSMRRAQNLACPEEDFFAEAIDYESGRNTIAQALAIIYSRQARARLGRLLDQRHIDIAHAHNIYHHLSPSVLLELKRRGIPVVLTAHDLKLACPNYRMLDRDGVCERCRGGRLWNPVLRRCHKDSRAASLLIAVESAVHQGLRLYRRTIDRVITPSRFYRDKLIEWGWPGDKLVHIPNFAPRTRSAPPPPPGSKFLYVGRLMREKGVATLVRAAAMTQIPVEIAGAGPLEPELRAQAAALQAPVSFLGACDKAELISLQAAARAVVLPSEWYENGPLSAIEAFEAGRPLIGARIGGITELIDEGVTGWSFEAGNATDLARALVAVRDAPDDVLRQMSAACFRHYEDNHTEDAYFARVSAVYDDLMAS